MHTRTARRERGIGLRRRWHRAPAAICQVRLAANGVERATVVGAPCVDAPLQHHVARRAVPAVQVVRMLLNGVNLLFRRALCVTQDARYVPVRLAMSI